MGDSQNWEEDFLNHKDLANSEDSRMVDVVFFGDSIIKGIPVDGINSFVFGIEGDTVSSNVIMDLCPVDRTKTVC